MEQDNEANNIGSQAWTSDQHILTCSGTCLEESPGIQHWKEDESGRAGWFSKTTITSKHLNSPSQLAGNEKQQEACMGEKEFSGKTQIQKAGVQEADLDSGDLEGI